jgi:hypothetical protein
MVVLPGLITARPIGCTAETGLPFSPKETTQPLSPAFQSPTASAGNRADAGLRSPPQPTKVTTHKIAKKVIRIIAPQERTLTAIRALQTTLKTAQHGIIERPQPALKKKAEAVSRLLPDQWLCPPAHEQSSSSKDRYRHPLGRSDMRNHKMIHLAYRTRPVSPVRIMRKQSQVIPGCTTNP